jgi:hypothetical protein
LRMRILRPCRLLLNTDNVVFTTSRTAVEAPVQSGRPLQVLWWWNTHLREGHMIGNMHATNDLVTRRTTPKSNGSRRPRKR